MKKIILLALLLVAVSGRSGYSAEFVTTEKDQKSVAITVYNTNLGLVKDVRTLKLDEGTVELKFMDVASGIKPETVYIKSIEDPEGLTVLEQNYEYDLLSPQKLMDKFVGRIVKLIVRNEHTDEEWEYEAELMSNNNGPIYKINNEIHINHPGRIVLPDIPENLIAKPTLVWLLNNSREKAQQLEVTYLTQGINWKADYTVVLNADDDACDMSGWVSINNKSGATYKDAKIKLIAGDVHQVQPERRYKMEMMDSMVMAGRAAPQFEEKEFFEYHIYTLQRLSTIKDKQNKQISLLEANDINVEKHFVVKAQRRYFLRHHDGSNEKVKVGVYVKFKNVKENNLGMPLPKGTIRVYKKDHEGSQQFVGEDSIDHTPKGEEIDLKLGEAFDIICERKQTDYKRLAANVHETAWEITLRNHKKEKVQVELLENLYGDWHVTESTHTYLKESANILKFLVDVPGDGGEVVVRYRVDVRY